MDCMVCGTPMRAAFHKDFDGAYGLDRVHYERCPDCRLVVSRTHYELSDGAWEDLNARYHEAFFGSDVNHDDPRWLERMEHQAQVLPAIATAGLAPTRRPWLDYGAGDGKLSDMVAPAGVDLRKFDRYLPDDAGDFLTESDLRPGAFDLVLTTCVFEHVRSREPLDEVNRLVADDGAMGLHTLVREEIPDDPSWFYLLPVHCTFLTNRAMALLAEQWGYAASLYAVQARLWCLLREDVERVREAAPFLPGEIAVSQGFCGYWP